MSKLTVGDVTAVMEMLAPTRMAAPGDPIGLCAGAPAWPVRRLCVALDCTPATLRQARARRCDMMVVHHPPFYHGLPNVAETTPAGALAGALARARMAVLAAHTNLDVVPGGINDWLADAAGLAARTPLEIVAREARVKWVVFTPETHLERVRAAICAAGAGVIGDYRDCTFRTAGQGTFRGGAGTQPRVGRAGRFEQVAEWRLEAVAPDSAGAAIERALRAAHPYEEPAFDRIPLADAIAHGCGRVGDLPRATTVAALARRMRDAARAPGVLLWSARRPVRRLAVWSGASCPVGAVMAARADTLVTGEIKHSDLLVLQNAGISVIILGHGACEAVIVRPLAQRLARALPGLAVVTADERSGWPVVLPRGA